MALKKLALLAPFVPLTQSPVCHHAAVCAGHRTYMSSGSKLEADLGPVLQGGLNWLDSTGAALCFVLELPLAQLQGLGSNSVRDLRAAKTKLTLRMAL